MKRTAVFLSLVFAMLVALVLPAALTPAAAEAEISSVVWLDTAFKGSDPMLGYIQAYEAGSAATLLVSFQNTTGDNITVKGAKVKFDWAGGEYAATAGNYPTTLVEGQSGTATISFTVPETSVASNQVKHRYVVSVDYDTGLGEKIGQQVAGETHYSDFFQELFTLNHHPIDASSVRVLVNETLRTDYTVHCDSGSIEFDDYLAYGAKVSVDYTYLEDVGTGDGTLTLFQLDHAPVVPGTLKVWVDCQLQPTTSYALDADAGTIKLSNPPAADRSVIAGYQYMYRWTWSDDDFAVYSSDQNGAMAVKQQLLAIGHPGVNTAGSRKLLSDSAMAEQVGDQQYAAGNLDEAKAQYDQALADLEKALKNDKDPNTFKAVEPAGTLLLGIGMLLLGLGAVVYVIRKPKAPTGG